METHTTENRAITSEALLQADELDFEFYRSSGPGGQNVNKVSTAVRLRFDVSSSKLLPEDVKERLTRMAGKRMTDKGILLIEAQRFRTQEQNREDAVERLMELIRKASQRPVKRRPTKPTAGSRERRLEIKQQRSRLKRGRVRIRNRED